MKRALFAAVLACAGAGPVHADTLTLADARRAALAVAVDVMLPLQGGVPLVRDGAVVGAIG